MMKVHVRTLLVLVVLFAFAACNNIDDPVSIGPTVFGKVVDETTKTAVEGATVTVSGRSQTTNVNGGFLLMDLPRGHSTLRVEKNGYVTHTEAIQVGMDSAEKKVTLRRQ